MPNYTNKQMNQAAGLLDAYRTYAAASISCGDDLEVADRRAKAMIVREVEFLNETLKGLTSEKDEVAA